MKILGLLSCGRSGADLFQSLLDGHDEILQFPGYILFNKQLLKIFSLQNKKILAEEFCKIYPHFFDSRINKDERHDQLGKKKNQYFFVDKKKFVKIFEKSIFDENNKVKIYINLNKAYYLASNRSLKKIKICLIHFHLFFNLMDFLKNISKKEKITIIMTLRDILASIGSTCYKWSKFRSDALDAHTLYLNIVGHIKQIFRLKKLGKKIYVIKMEKLHEENEKVMREFCKIFNLKFKRSLTESTYLGKKWWGDKTSLKYLDGINPKFKNKFYSQYFYQKDIDLIERKIFNLLKFYNYPIRSSSNTNKLLDIIPYRFEYLIWLNSFKKLNLKKILKIPLFWLLRFLNLYNNNIYKNFNFPYSIGSKKMKNYRLKK